MATNGAVRAIFLPTRSGEMAARDALDGKDRAAFRAGEASLEFRQIDPGGQIETGDVVRADVFGEREPVARKGGEDFALVRDRRGHDDVVGGDAVGGDEPDFVAPGVKVAHLAVPEELNLRARQPISWNGHLWKC